MSRHLKLVLALALLGLALLVAGCSLLGAAGPQEPWPPSASGRPTLYYFGDPG